jgi:hypothetical protein
MEASAMKHKAVVMKRITSEAYASIRQEPVDTGITAYWKSLCELLMELCQGYPYQPLIS